MFPLDTLELLSDALGYDAGTETPFVCLTPAGPITSLSWKSRKPLFSLRIWGRPSSDVTINSPAWLKGLILSVIVTPSSSKGTFPDGEQ